MLNDPDMQPTLEQLVGIQEESLLNVWEAGMRSTQLLL